MMIGAASNLAWKLSQHQSALAGLFFCISSTFHCYFLSMMFGRAMMSFYWDAVTTDPESLSEPFKYQISQLLVNINVEKCLLQVSNKSVPKKPPPCCWKQLKHGGVFFGTPCRYLLPKFLVLELDRVAGARLYVDLLLRLLGLSMLPPSGWGWGSVGDGSASEE